MHQYHGIAIGQYKVCAHAHWKTHKQRKMVLGKWTLGNKLLRKTMKGN